MDKIDKIFLVFVIQELSLVQPFVTPQTVAGHSPLSLEFFKYWSGLPFPTPGDFPDPGIEPSVSCVSNFAGRFFYS